jgi:type II secretory ATPase GspE/PulE/Tfp pilus assembly ATPase PilB-like protein
MSTNLQDIVSEIFARMGRLLTNGVPMLKSLEVLAMESTGLETQKKILDTLRYFVEFGRSFSDSLTVLKIFPADLITAVAEGESSGTLDRVLLNLSDPIAKGVFTIETLDKMDSITDSKDAEDLILPVTKRLHRYLIDAINAGASDIHFNAGPDNSIVRYRIDGVLQTQSDPLPKADYSALISRLKVMANLDVAEHKFPQDGRILMRTKAVPGKQIDLRVSICPYLHGENAVIRILDSTTFPKNLDAVGIPDNHVQTIRRWLKNPFGLILSCGPTGSGKTTTLYLMLQELSEREGINALSIEDPVELIIPGVQQMTARTSIGITYAAALRTFMRQDPDIIMVGEIRDAETAQMMTQAALTGHLLLSQLHARNGVSAVKLLHDLGIPTYMLREILTGIVTQRLVRRLCTHCRKPLTQEEVNSLPNPEQFTGCTLFKPEGCEKCHQTGFRGRSVIMELFEPKPEFWPSLTDTSTVEQLMSHVSADHKTLLDDGIRLVKDGITCMSEVNRVMGH